eukprot:1092770-Prymnesium_polylepis.3
MVSNHPEDVMHRHQVDNPAEDHQNDAEEPPILGRLLHHAVPPVEIALAQRRTAAGPIAAPVANMLLA